MPDEDTQSDNQDTGETSGEGETGENQDTKIEPEVRDTDEETSKDEDEIAPEDEKTIGKIVDKRLKGLGIMKDQLEVENFVRTNPEYSKYRSQILTYMKNDAYKRVPVGNIAAIVAAKDQQKLGAEKERKAQEEAAATEGVGTSIRPTGSAKKDWKNMDTKTYYDERAKLFNQPT